MQSDPDTMEQSESIAAALLHETQLKFNTNEIHFYDPGAGHFCHIIV